MGEKSSALSGLFSSQRYRGTFPVRLQDHERAEFLVDISSHPVEQLQDIGVGDAEKRQWSADKEELKHFIHVAKLYQSPNINPTA